MANNTSRRAFLRTAPLAAAVGFTLVDTLKAAAQGSSGGDVAAAAVPFKLFTGKELEADAKTLH